ncbi:MAG: hypothetical protein HY582_02145 [Candidatus Omnitrophica bacterium]|nr:hypothetical protein [Candidatus Omnitrophota bacterium]
MWDAVTEHWGLKLVSLFLAIGFWFYAVGEETVEVVRNIPLRIETEKKEMSVASQSVNSLNVRLRAPRSLLSVLSSNEVKAFHRVSGVTQAGEYSFRINSDDIKLGSGEIRVTGIFPETVGVTIDETIVKKLPVVPNLVGDPAYGYKVLKEKVEVDPNAILIEGPKVQLGKLDAVKTEPIELIGRTHSFRKLVRIILEPNLKPTSETIIDVFVPIYEEYSERSFPKILVKPLGVPAKDAYAELDTETISFDLKGPASELERLSQAGVFVYVDVTNLEKGSHEIPVKFVLPETVSLKGQPPKVKLTIKKSH